MNFSKNLINRVKSYVDYARAMKGSRQTGQFYHVTFICKKRKVIAIGFNNLTKLLPPTRWGTYKASKNNCRETYAAGIHSEISAIIKCGHEDCSSFDFFNIRINNKGEIANSKPCFNCQRVLNQVGYKNIYYFDNKRNLCVI